MVCVLFVAVTVPIRLGFNMDETTFSRVITPIIDVSFLIDIILTFFTPYFDEMQQQTICNHREIALNYLKTWLIIDILSIFPFEFVLGNIVKDKRISTLN